MVEFYVSFEDEFVCGKCKYKAIEPKAFKNTKTGEKSILLKCKVVDINGVSAIASSFLRGDIARHFCEVNKMNDCLESGRITVEACENRSSGICIVALDRDPKYKRITEFLDEEMTSPLHKPISPQATETFDDDIPF